MNPSTPKQRLAALVQAAGVTPAELARRLGWSKQQSHHFLYRQADCGLGTAAAVLAAIGRPFADLDRTHQGEPRMGRVTLRNDFHNSSAVVVVPSDGVLSARQVARVRRALCGIAGCTCGGFLGERGPQDVDIEPVYRGGMDEPVFMLVAKGEGNP